MGPGIDEGQVDELTVSYVGLDGRRLGRQSRAEVRWQPGETEKTVTASVDASVTGDSRGGGSGGGGWTRGRRDRREIGRDALEADNTTDDPSPSSRRSAWASSPGPGSSAGFAPTSSARPSGSPSPSAPPVHARRRC